MAGAQDLSQLVSKLRISANIPPPATNFCGTDEGLGNIYIFSTKPGTNIVYRYDVEIIEQRRQKPLTKGGGDDGKKGLLREICYDLVATTFKNMNGGNVIFVYDNRKILYTNRRVDSMLLEIKPEQMSEYSRKFLHNAPVTLELKPCRDAAHELNLDEVGRALQPSPDVQADRSLRTFLEMLTSQAFINARTHAIVGAGRLFEKQEARKINPAITTHKGVAKGVRIIVNGEVKPCPALVADVKTCAFFAAGNLEEIANAMIQQAQQRRRLDPYNRKQMDGFWSDFGQLYKGVSAYLTYAPSRVIVIDSITTRTCAEVSFEVDGKAMTMPDFFRIKKNTNINPNMPAVRQHVDRDSLYPLATLQILPMQRLGLDKMSLNEDMANISKELLTSNSIKPELRYKAIEEEMRKIGVVGGDCAKLMMAFNVRLKGGSNDVKIGRLPLPNIMYGNNRQQQQDERGRFDVRGSVRYLEPSAVLKSWVIAHPRKVGEDQYREFIGRLMDMANQRAMRLPKPRFELMETTHMETLMENLAKNKIQFLLYIDNKYTKSHSELKLYEKRYNLLTQHVTIEMIQKAGQASVSNVLNKMNMKLFGHNYMPEANPACKNKLDLTSGSVLVIGIDTSKPPRATAFERYQMRKKGFEDLESEDPMIVGICGNYVKNPVKFVGDYYCQPCTQDILNPGFLIEKLKWMLNQLKVNRPQAPPKVVFIIRDGVSEGMIPKLLATGGEFKAFEEACRQFAPTWKPKFVYCIVDKRHNKRFFVKGRQGAQNTMPGSVIDRKFIRVDMHEFFLQAHFPLKGVSKIPQYVFPVNQINADNNEMQAFIHYLCNMWQIVNLAPALPTPVLQAKELAKRGRNNYTELKRHKPHQIPRLNNGQVDLKKLNKDLSYGEATYADPTFKLNETRINA